MPESASELCHKGSLFSQLEAALLTGLLHGDFVSNVVKLDSNLSDSQAGFSEGVCPCVIPCDVLQSLDTLTQIGRFLTHTGCVQPLLLQSYSKADTPLRLSAGMRRMQLAAGTAMTSMATDCAWRWRMVPGTGVALPLPQSHSEAGAQASECW